METEKQRGYNSAVCVVEKYQIIKHGLVIMNRDLYPDLMRFLSNDDNPSSQYTFGDIEALTDMVLNNITYGD